MRMERRLNRVKNSIIGLPGITGRFGDCKSCCSGNLSLILIPCCVFDVFARARLYYFHAASFVNCIHMSNYVSDVQFLS